VILTFDPADLKSSFECVEFLQQKGITISQKLGARLLALNIRGIQVSPVILEDAKPGSLIESFLLSRELHGELSADKSIILGLISRAGLNDSLCHIVENDTLKLVSPFEMEKDEVGQFLPARRETPTQFLSPTSLSPHSIFADRRFLEETTLNFLDSDDPERVIESLKKLVRAALLSSNDPTPLFRTALSMDRPLVWRAAAGIIKEMVDLDLGSRLENLLDERDWEKRKYLWRGFLIDPRAHREPLWGELLMQLLINMIRKKEFGGILMDSIPQISKLLERYPHYMSELVRTILVNYGAFSSEELYHLREFLCLIAREFRPFHDAMLGELKRSAPPASSIILLWLLSPFQLDRDEEELIITLLDGLIREPIKDPTLLTMIKAILLRFVPRSLLLLSSKDRYQSMEREMQLYVLELWEHLVTSGKGPSEPKEALLDIIIFELNSPDPIAQRRILRTKFLQDREILDALRQKVVDSISLIEAAVITSSSQHYVEDRSRLFAFLRELIPGAALICFEMIQKNFDLDEDISDHISFICDYVAFCAEDFKHDNELLRDLCTFLNLLSRSEKRYTALAIEGLGTLYARMSSEKRQVSHFVKRVIQSLSLPLEVQIRILCNLYLSRNLTARSRASIEDFLIEKLKTRSLNSSELSFLLEEQNRILNTGAWFTRADEFVDLFSREIALKLTQPTIHEIMRTEALQKEPSRYLTEYENNPWTWDDVAQALFILVKLHNSRRLSSRSSEKIIRLLAHILHHYALAHTRRLSQFFLQEIVLFRILRDILDHLRKEGDEAAILESMVRSIMDLMEKGKDRETIMANEDLQHFLAGACRFIAQERRDDAAGELQHLVIHALMRAARGGSEIARRIVLKILHERWLKPELAVLIRNLIVQ
jgi:hypothetical protein